MVGTVVTGWVGGRIAVAGRLSIVLRLAVILSRAIVRLAIILLTIQRGRIVGRLPVLRWGIVCLRTGLT